MQSSLNNCFTKSENKEIFVLFTKPYCFYNYLVGVWRLDSIGPMNDSNISNQFYLRVRQMCPKQFRVFILRFKQAQPKL